MLHKQISLCEQLADLSELACLCYTWAIPHADDWGTIKGGARVFRAQVLPLRDVSVAQVQEALDRLVSVGLLVRYIVDGETYLHFPTWEDFQTGLHKRTDTNRLPLPEEATEPIEDASASGNFRELPGITHLARAGGTEQNRTKQNNGFAAPADPPPAEQPSGDPPPKQTRTKTDRDIAFEACLGVFDVAPSDLDNKAWATYAKAMNRLVGDSCLEEIQYWAETATADGPRALGTGGKPERVVPAAVRKDITANGWQASFARARRASPTGRFVLRHDGVRLGERDWDENTRCMVTQYAKAGMWDEERGMATNDKRHPSRQQPEGAAGS